MFAPKFLFVLTALPLAAEPVSFERSVRPILSERCEVCHSAKNAGGGLSMASVASILAYAGKIGESITGPKPRMPKAGAPLTASQVAIIVRWIEEGARDDSQASSKEETWWSLRPIRKPQAHKSVDDFVREKLRQNRLEPSPEADRRTLVRRLYFDLHGLPPTPEEAEAFVRDRSPDAYEKLVDKLLASPRYGERWARHWLDAVHYGDSHGYDKDKPRPNAWPYRDYVIRALNEDKPYGRFIREQLAADVLYPDDPSVFPATGFLAAGPWDFVGHQELREGTTDKLNTRSLDRDDMVATTISTFNSMTAHCARCHDHKFDPIAQEDYYNLQAVFAGIDRADRPFDDDPVLHRKRQDLIRERQSIQERLQPLLDKVEFASSPEIVDLDSSIQDARLLIAHIGTPKTAADAETKKQLEARVSADRGKRKALVDAIVGADTYSAMERIQAEAKTLDAQIDALPKPRFVYSGAGYFTRVGTFRPSLQPRPVHVLLRGSVQSPGKMATPGALPCVPGLEARFGNPAEGQRRAALANWIADDRNVLTWRSIVNRVWHYHFGAGLVDTPNDFGKMGSKPTHPELLDWLAVWFRDDARGSLKALHKLIVTSATYRQSSAHRADAAKVDSENRLLWRMNRTRLDAESVRDAVLQTAGKLDLQMGGPAVRMFYFKDDHSPVYDYSRFDPDSEGAYRRSIYRFIVRSVPDPFMERLDCPDPSILTPKRSTTITAIQALAMWNNRFMLRMAEHFAARVRSSAADPARQVRSAIELALGRPATAEEAQKYGGYAATHGLENLARVLFNTNEFLFVD